MTKNTFVNINKLDILYFGIPILINNLTYNYDSLFFILFTSFYVKFYLYYSSLLFLYARIGNFINSKYQNNTFTYSTFYSLKNYI
jgi:hypothetical protein